jgi:hypothetical protein
MRQAWGLARRSLLLIDGSSPGRYRLGNSTKSLIRPALCAPPRRAEQKFWSFAHGFQRDWPG